METVKLASCVLFVSILAGVDTQSTNTSTGTSVGPDVTTTLSTVPLSSTSSVTPSNITIPRPSQSQDNETNYTTTTSPNTSPWTYGTSDSTNSNPNTPGTNGTSDNSTNSNPNTTVNPESGGDKTNKLSPNFCNRTRAVEVQRMCIPCFIAQHSPCPNDTRSLIKKANCSSRQIGNWEFCLFSCEAELVEPECCPGFWGRDCQSCPKILTNDNNTITNDNNTITNDNNTITNDNNTIGICSGHGFCSDGISGYGNCTCDEAFSGTACERCSRDDVYGKNCDEVCHCVHGYCHAGRMGTGTCSCHHGYDGPTCDRQTHCLSHLCHENAHCVDGDPVSVNCVCDLGYTGDGSNCSLIDLCSEDLTRCHDAANCTMNGPANFTCTCKEGYSGDGFVCQPIDYCQDRENIACPDNYTTCVYRGPGQFDCQCQRGYKNLTKGIGCQLRDLCEEKPNICHRHANCSMIGPAMFQCECREGYIGNGRACYGNILETLNELNLYNSNLRFRLNQTIQLFSIASKALESKQGLTVFLPLSSGLNLDTATRNNEHLSAQIVRNHVIPVTRTTNELKSKRVFYTLEGTQAIISSNRRNGRLTYKLQGYADRARIITGNVVAANGVIHFINQLLLKPPVIRYKPKQTLFPQIQSDGRYNRLESLLASAGLQAMLNSSTSNITVLAPNNKAWDSLLPGTVQYLQSRAGREKLKTLLKNHILPGRIVSFDLLYTNRLTTMANNVIQVDINNAGRMLLNGNITFSQTDIPAVGGVYHHVSGILIPESIKPLLPKYCNKITEERVDGLCGPCTETLHCALNSDVPDRTQEPIRCTFQAGNNGSGIAGCSQPCIRRTTERQCCSNFYGPNCNPCPGGHISPCGARGQCQDGVKGSGKCQCQQNFTGTICEKCSNPSRFGPQCDKECTCLNGICDNRVTSQGHCKLGSCQGLHSGIDCQMVYKMCGRRIQCHVHSVCKMTNMTSTQTDIISRTPWWFLWNHLRCHCKDGYEGNGKQCTAINPCESRNSGGCHVEAECVYTSPGQNNCTCNPGWVGDGTYCYPSTPCSGHTNCSPDAQCLPTIPGEYRCECNEEYHGNGTYCVANNMCDYDHGGCHVRATCLSLGPGNRSCACNMGYAGDGISCFGNVWQEIQAREDISVFADLLHSGRLSDFISDYTKQFTVFAPQNSSFSAHTELTPDIQNLRYHIVQGIYNTEHLANLAQSRGTSGSSFMATLAQNGQDNPELNITYTTTGPLINSAHIVSSNHFALNGMIHIIDRGLHPIEPASNLNELFSRHSSMSHFYRDLSQTGFLTAFSNGSIPQYTIFAVENNIWKPQLQGELLTKFMSYYILRYDISYETLASRDQVATVMGPGPSSRLNITSRNGKVLVNSIIVQDDRLKSPNGSVFKLMSMLNANVYRCDRQHIDGSVQAECCPGYYGFECNECPGGSETPCSNQGFCDQGISGSGICTCKEGFSGDDCDSCIDGYRGPNCTFDPCSLCHEHAKCITQGVKASCLCIPGYTGDGSHCLPACQVDNGGCDENANCSASLQTGEITCRCNQGYHGIGWNCSQIWDLCSEDHGGCSELATCTFYAPDTDSVSNGSVQCSCRENYTGNGTFCNGDLISTLSSMNETRDFSNVLLDVMARKNPYGELMRSMFSNTEGRRTIFAPINWQLANTSEANVDIERHIVEDYIVLNDTIINVNSSIFLTVSGENLTVENPGMGYFTVNNTHVVQPNIPSINGIIHLIEKPLEAEIIAETLPVRSSASMTATPFVIGGLLVIIIIIIVVALVIAKRRANWPCLKRQDHINNDFNFKILNSYDSSEPSGEMFDATGVFKNPLYDRLVDL